MRRSGGIRQRVRPQWPQQREQNRHAIYCAQGRVQPLVVSAPSQRGTTRQLFTPDGGRSTQDTARFFKAATGSESLEGRIWYLGGRLVHRHRSLPAPLSRARVGVRLQPAPPDQPYCPDSSRVVCRSRSGPMRVGIPHSHPDRGVGIPSVLVLTGACESVLHPGHRKVTTFRSEGLDLRRFKVKNMGVCAKGDLLAISLSPQQPFPSSPMFGRGVSPGANRAMHCATWAPSHSAVTKANRISDLPRH